MPGRHGATCWGYIEYNGYGFSNCKPYHLIGKIYTTQVKQKEISMLTGSEGSTQDMVRKTGGQWVNEVVGEGIYGAKP